MRLLLLLTEFRTWGAARHWSYAAQLGMEEGLRANGIEPFTITSPWFSRAPELCKGRKFDQVWLEIVHLGSPRTGINARDLIGDAWFDWLESVAPVRVGFAGESLECQANKSGHSSELNSRKVSVLRRLKRITHLVAIDEQDVAEINAAGEVKSIWWPQAVPGQFICDDAPSLPQSRAVFCGGVYQERERFLRHPELSQLLVHLPSPERGTVYPSMFLALHLALRVRLKSRVPVGEQVLSSYLSTLRWIRRRCFGRWIQTLRMGHSVVNLPHLLRAYPGRVFEGMAAVRPVITSHIPDRPRTDTLFEPGKEILLFPEDQPQVLAEHIRRIQREPTYGHTIATNARRRLLALHTVEKRVEQILRWIETGEVPAYA